MTESKKQTAEPWLEKAEYTNGKTLHPWRRLTARILDTGIYFTICALFSQLVLRQYLFAVIYTRLAMRMAVITLIVEPVFIAVSGTTPGKWCMGMRVRASYNEKPAYGAAFMRTLGMVFLGLGAYLPVIGLIMPIIAYRRYIQGKSSAWDDSQWLHNEFKMPFKPKIAEYISVCAACVLIAAVCSAFTMLPSNRGDITVSQYSENFNELTHYYYTPFYELKERDAYTSSLYEEGVSAETVKLWARYFFGISEANALDAQGNWTAESEYPLLLNYDLIGVRYGEIEDRDPSALYPVTKQLYPEFSYETENGRLTGVKIAIDVDATKFSVTAYDNLYTIAALAFSCEDEDMMSSDYYQLRNRISSYKPFENYSFTQNGITVSSSVEYYGLERDEEYEWIMNKQNSANGKSRFYAEFAVMKADN